MEIPIEKVSLGDAPPRHSADTTEVEPGLEVSPILVRPVVNEILYRVLDGHGFARQWWGGKLAALQSDVLSSPPVIKLNLNVDSLMKKKQLKVVLRFERFSEHRDQLLIPGSYLERQLFVQNTNSQKRRGCHVFLDAQRMI